MPQTIPCDPKWLSLRKRLDPALDDPDRRISPALPKGLLLRLVSRDELERPLTLVEELLKLLFGLLRRVALHFVVETAVAISSVSHCGTPNSRLRMVTQYAVKVNLVEKLAGPNLLVIAD